MNAFDAHLPTLKPKAGTSLWGALFAFAFAAFVGAGLLGIRWAVRGNADPFNVAWPTYLQVGSLVSTIFVGILSRRPFTAAFGMYFGLVACMLVFGQAEYPVASAIALAVHGFLPALAGGTCLTLFRALFGARRLRDRN